MFPEILTKFSRTLLFWNLVPEHTPPPPINESLPRVQVEPYPEPHPPEMKFFPESKTDLTQNTPPIENSNFLSRVQNHWRIQGGRQGRAPPWGSKFFHFHAVFGKKLKNNSTFGSWRPPRENPGSATAKLTLHRTPPPQRK